MAGICSDSQNSIKVDYQIASNFHKINERQCLFKKELQDYMEK